MPYKTQSTFAIRGRFCLPLTFREEPEKLSLGAKAAIYVLAEPKLYGDEFSHSVT